MCPYLLTLTMNEYIALVSIISNLALDPCIAVPSARGRHGGSSSSVELIADLAEVASSTYGLPRLEPVIAAYRSERRFHLKHQLLRYLGWKALSLGNFLTGRNVGRGQLDGGMLTEVAEEASLLPHLDLRHRRFVFRDSYDGRRVPDKKLRRGLWYLPIALAAGVHRWGMSWRRIVLSTLAMHRHFMSVRNLSDIYEEGDPADEDELLALAFADASYTLTLYRKVIGESGEYFYSVYREPEKVSRESRRLVNSLLSKLGSRVSVRESMFKLVELYRELIGEDIEALMSVLNTHGRTSGRRSHLSNVYITNAKAMREVAAKLANIVRTPGGGDSESCACIFFVTETWSPYNIYSLIDYIALETRERCTTLKIVLLFTPQTLPQTLFSILTLTMNDPRNGNLSECQFVNNRDAMHNLCTMESCRCRDTPFKLIESIRAAVNANGEIKQYDLDLYLVPLIGKSPSVTYTELTALVKYLIGEEGVDRILTHAAFTGIASVEASLIRLESELLNSVVVLPQTNVS